ncbi:MAG: beta-galactosidase family protein [Cellvibrio sp.]
MKNLNKVLRLLGAAFCLAVTSNLASASSTNNTAKHTFVISGSQFLQDGKPYQVIAGDMHYPRIPREYWRDRFKKAKAMGLNTLTLYSFWNLHEPSPGVYDFSGQNDIAKFIRQAQKEGLNVILRPGPYVCAEWELGGYPSWLLKDKNLVLRSTDPAYRARVQSWFKRLAKEIKPLLLKNGGPIVAVQLENEYGALGEDIRYLQELKEDLVASGLGDAQLFTSNQPTDIEKGSLPDVPTVVNFGVGNAERAYKLLEAARPQGPRMTGEYWAGWFDKWGEAHHETDGKKEADEFRWMIERGYSVSLYMFHGGTTFGWMNGADSHKGLTYHPDTTSYDYDAPLDESGTPRYKFNLLRQAIMDVTKVTPPDLPRLVPQSSYPVAPIERSASLWDHLPKPVESVNPLTFEELDQSFGYVLYQTTLAAGEGGTLTLNGLHSYAQIYIDRKLVGTLDRRNNKYDVQLPKVAAHSTLDILVENTGRVNYSKAIRGERAGLTGDVILDGKLKTHWKMYSLPMDDLSNIKFINKPCFGPCFYKTDIKVNKPADTWLDTRGLHKGQLWLGKHNLGRFWSIGPVYTLYTPKPWLKRGKNTITLFDLQGSDKVVLKSVDKPIWGDITNISEPQ